MSKKIYRYDIYSNIDQSVKNTKSVFKNLNKEDTLKHLIAILLQYFIACEKHNYIDEYHSPFSPLESRIEKGPLDRNDSENDIVIDEIVDLTSQFEDAKFPFIINYLDYITPHEYDEEYDPFHPPLKELRFSILRSEIKLPNYVFGKKKQGLVSKPKNNSKVLSSLLTIKKKPNNKKKQLGPIISELPGTATAPGRFRIRLRK